MKKAISFSIFGNSEKYLVGLDKNIDLCKKYYPDWLIYVYFDDSVPNSYVNRYKSKGAIMFDMTENKFPGMVWRFMPDDVDLFICRDADSRITLREKMAVDQWIESQKTLHVMRDHPHHNFPILGGMWGIRIGNDISIRKELEVYFSGESKNTFTRMRDMDFLRDVIYSKFLDNSLVHDSYYSINKESLSFPIKMENYEFVGEIYEADDTRNYQYQEWIGKSEK